MENQAIFPVSFGATSIPVKWPIISADCKSILVGNAATALRMIYFNKNKVCSYQLTRLIKILAEKAIFL